MKSKIETMIDKKETMHDVNDLLDSKESSLKSSLESTRSMQISLEAIRIGDAGLTRHRTNMLNRVPNQGDYASFPRDSVEIKDLAYLSAQEGHEFALLRTKSNDILFHGTERECNFTDDLEILLMSRHARLIAHSHPDVGMIVPSKADRDFLRKINQPSSKIISWYTGQMIEYKANQFEE